VTLFHNLLILQLAAFLALWPTAREASAVEPINFERQIRPLLIKRCGECHGAKEQNSGLRLDAKFAAFKGGDGGPVIKSGKSIESELVRRITSEDPDERMPPEDPPLTKTEIELLRRWIDSGANWPETDYDREAARDRRLEHWSFQPLRKFPESLTKDARDKAAEIDRYVAVKLAEHGLQPSPPVDRRSLIRRACFDIIGSRSARATRRATTGQPSLR
jgi:mono/diheme cytochrome c family protein